MSGFKSVITGIALVAVTVTSCSTVRDATYRGVSSAVGDAVEREVYRGASAWLANYTSGMLYQLAYTQAFMMGGYGVGLEDFDEGQGATWQIETVHAEESYSYLAERALLKVNDDGSSWWYLRYQPEGDDAMEYEIKLTEAQDPLEMYMKNPESGEVEHYEFDPNNSELEESEQQLKEDGFNTQHYDIENWESYKEGSEMVRVGTHNYNATILSYQGSEEEGDEDVEARWWLAEDVPGELLKYEMNDRSDGSRTTGTMTDLRNNYSSKFGSF